MATVRDLSGNAANAITTNNGVDPSYENANRTNAGEPNGSITPQYAGERILDTTNNCLWQALTLTNTSWVALTPPN